MNAVYNGTAALRGVVNQLITDFVHQDKYVTALCHGVSVLAWAHVDGKSLLSGHQVTTYQGASPAYLLNGTLVSNQADRWHSETTGATVFAPGSIGDPRTDTDGVFVDGKLITGQNYNSARRFGEELARQLIKYKGQASMS